MNIALMAHDNKKELMVQFCTAYCGILAKHTLCATARTGQQIADATGSVQGAADRDVARGKHRAAVEGQLLGRPVTGAPGAGGHCRRGCGYKQ